MRVFAVTTTGIYCRPGCPARRPRPEHVRWFRDGAAARRGGYRACKRCRPEQPDLAARRMAALCRRIEADPSTASLAELARLAGLSRFHLLRAFRRVVGVTPRDYASSLRRREEGLPRELRWSSAPSPLGRIFVARSARGICAVSIGRRDFPEGRRDDAGLRPLLRAVVALAAGSAPAPDLPLDVRATAFEQRVWRALRAIPPGETRSYGELAKAIGRPGAARAVGRACAANRIALLIPCHRATRSDGSPGGYRWGVARKRALLRARSKDHG
jgi:AraC family transcriptional regulator of adaptative response/methylated-DNA-[protein]-cysteine methyltransferase